MWNERCERGKAAYGDGGDPTSRAPCDESGLTLERKELKRRYGRSCGEGVSHGGIVRSMLGQECEQDGRQTTISIPSFTQFHPFFTSSAIVRSQIRISYPTSLRYITLGPSE